MKNKRAALQELVSLVGPIVAVGVVIVIGFLMLAQMKTQIVDLNSGSWCNVNYTFNKTNGVCYNVTAYGTSLGSNYTPGYDVSYNATGTTQTALATIPGWLPIIIVAIIGAALLALVQYFTRR